MPADGSPFRIPDDRAPGALRVACVTETWPPEVNGVSLSFARLVSGLRARHHVVQLIRPQRHRDDAARHEPGYDEVLADGLPIPRYPDLRMGLPCGRRLRQLWTTTRPDVVHIATEGPLGWSALCAAKRLGLPVTSDFRTNFHAYSAHYGIGLMRRPITAYLRWFHNATARTTVPTSRLARQLERQGFRSLAVVSRGVDSTRFRPSRHDSALRRQWGADDDDLVVLSVGRLAAEKNLETLRSTWEAIHRVDRRARFVVVGSGPMRAALQAACPEAHFVGQRTGEDLAAHYASADLLLFPSTTETFGNVTAEAMASGLAVVAFDHAAAGELIVDGRNGALAPLGDVDSYRRGALMFASDPVRRRAAGRAARETVVPLDWEHIVDRFDGMLRSVIHEAGCTVAPSPIADLPRRTA